MTVIEQVIKLQFEVRECPECYIRYGVPVGFIAERCKDHNTFYCPNGHTRYFPQDNETEALRKSLHAATLAKERAERIAREAAAAKETAEREAFRLKTRAKAGVCPCCNRTFKQLAAHMKNKHPGVDEVVTKRLKSAKPFFTKAQLEAAAKHPIPDHLFQGADVRSPKVD